MNETVKLILHVTLGIDKQLNCKWVQIKFKSQMCSCLYFFVSTFMTQWSICGYVQGIFVLEPQGVYQKSFTLTESMVFADRDLISAVIY